MTDNSWHSATEIQGIFDRIAPVYDQLNQRLSLGQHRIWKQMTVKWCEPQPGDVGLDVCCGSGDLAQLLARKVGKTGRVVGLDFSPEQLAIADLRAQNNYPSLALKWVEGDALTLPFEDNTFDCATMGYGLRNVVDIPRCLQELHRVLKPTAKVAILDFHRPTQPWMRTLQQWYLDNFVVPTAKGFGLTDEYAYIMPSLERFPLGTEQVKLAYEAGFSHAVHYLIAGGMMGVLVGTKD
ncbi:bifunctional demethylmenaquinone methyltransferase/2-methoxy-6-polyprenyl-1,4-benzoquinol methylase UbiE [Crocosphaera sp. UHCC 0190]|uniref:bifunctional demethylmenaquinone methyltransferase/2-methoxy-6-polyprenyl-1,4-benzoquinol methylase UbiE n=1 Tax=Crocosphaera sp. UHCC 0190 TaxID=3110246 RepID=UPI002B1FC068|nr:bifunctional demethylmenaquinone methyltransferase/2-methoxy-6-polyprenyl-1,4-benzoquinol methylase UbiE [Crocosphaera sp. UHCC 0190]MEA5512173.1 bifunctional demethylmenaquinone methyltransferase/2-methoxy-6-polyprenyl-1,4-benzoquinol methylase UbiE [Crocosphaera sp. UHCC 0190]